MSDIFVASKNKNKIREISRILKEVPVEVRSVYEEINTANDIEETGMTFKENAVIKALAFSDKVEGYVLADDSGLCVDYLGGKPGVYSARYAGTGATDEDNNIKLLRELEGVSISRRTAKFVCVIALANKGKILGTFYGECKGFINIEPRGSNGFGYDPLFLLENGKTMAELTSDEKNSISHRASALRKLKRFMEEDKCET